jgi:D-glycero-D-manno-heptose 1,7-bisphosphate phosphatase
MSNRAIFIDRDGTLIIDHGYIKDPNIVELIPGTKQALEMLKSAGFMLFIVTNQSGVGRGMMTTSDVKAVNDRLIQLIGEDLITQILTCYHTPDDNCNCRKPNTKLIEDIKTKYDLDLSNSYSIGDKDSDKQLGENLGGKGIKIGENNINTLLDAVKQIASFKPYLYKNKPDHIQIETTIICNAKCDFCTQRKVTRRPKRMEDSVWKKIIDDTRGWGVSYRPFLLNEPFADTRMLDICRYIKQDKTAKIEFNTNGSLITPKVTDSLLEIGVDIVRFSIDGFFEQEYNKRRKGLDFKTVENNTEYFCKNAGKDIFTEVRMIAFPNTEREQELFKEKWTKIAKNVLITELYRYPWEGQTEPLYKPCFKIRKEMFFYVDGRATLCCWDTNERGVIGDVKEQTVSEIWNGEPLKSYRNILDNGERDKILLCSRCDAYKNANFDMNVK